MSDTKNIPYVDQRTFRIACDEVLRVHGGQAVIGDPFADKNGRIFADVTRNDKFVDHVFLGESEPAKVEELLRGDFTVSENKFVGDTHSIGATCQLHPVPEPVLTQPAPAAPAKVDATGKPTVPPQLVSQQDRNRGKRG